MTVDILQQNKNKNPLDNELISGWVSVLFTYNLEETDADGYWYNWHIH